MEMPLAGQRFAIVGETSRIVGQSLQRVAAAPGVDAAAVTLTGAPLSGATSFLNMTVPGRSLGGPYFNGGYLGGWQVVSPGYFDTLRIPVVAGRVFGGFRGLDDRSRRRHQPTHGAAVLADRKPARTLRAHW